MTDREKVVKGLECCHQINQTECFKCPYSRGNGCTYALMGDALALLKAQQPRVMTLDEVLAHYSLPPVFPDDLGMQEDYFEDIQPLYFEFPHDREDYWIVHWRGYSQVARYLDEWKYSYNKKWRCWTSRPTDEQKEATQWQE